MSADLKELLQRRAEDIRIPADLPPATFRRARRRRGWAAAFVGVTTITLVAGTVVALQSTVFSSGRRIGNTPGTTTPAPTEAPTQAPPVVDTEHAVPAVWPEANLTDIQAEQERVHAGADPWRTDPAETARTFGRTVLGWDDVYVEFASPDPTSGLVQPVLHHAPQNGLVPYWASAGVRLELSQLARTGSGGVWSVVDFSSGDLAFEAGPLNVGTSCEPDRLATGHPAMLCGTVPTPVPPRGIVRYALFQGSELDLGAVTGAPVWGEIPPGADGRFAGGMTENVVEDATVLLVELLDGDGGVIAAATERLPALGASEPSPSRPGIGDGSQPELTDQVKDVRSAIMAAADAQSYEGLRRLIGQGFTFSFGDTGGESSTADRAIAFWQRDGDEPLRVMSALLEMPYTTVPTDEGLIYAWPALYNWTPDQLSRIDELAPEWREALEQIYPDFDRQLQSWIDFGGYLGWRIGIAEDGRWMFFVAGD